MMYSCSHPNDTPHTQVRRTGRRIETVTVDIHCHLHAPEADDLVPDKGQMAQESIVRFATEETRAINQAMLADIRSRLVDPQVRIADMDRLGIDIQAISPNPFQYYYWTEPELGRAVARSVNDRLAEVAAQTPDRFVALGTVPLQHTDFAIAELERITSQLGMRGVEINTHINGEELSAERLRPFWAKAEELNILVFLHPIGFTEGQRLGEHYLNNLIGQPLESSLAISQLIYGGVLENHPGLKICVPHGGGYLPMFSGRLDHAYHTRSDCRHGVSKEPSAYLKQLYFDTVVFSNEHLAHLVSLYGASQLLLGTDYPYDMGEPDAVGFVTRTPSLSDGQKQAICGGNAMRLLGIGKT